MNAILIEHVKVSELPESWRKAGNSEGRASDRENR